MEFPYRVFHKSTAAVHVVRSAQELVDALLASGRPVSYAEIETDAGHDAFLLDEPRYTGLFTAWMQQVVI